MSTQRNILPLIIIIMLLVYSLIMYLFTNTLLGIKFFSGLLMTVMSLLLYIKWKRFYTLVFMIVLLLGVFNVISFFYIEFSFQFFLLGINPFIFLVLILHIILDFEAIYQSDNNDKSKE